MKKTIDFSGFRQAFIDYNRIDNFSEEGLAELYDGLIQLEEDTGQELELDVISLCCDFRESTIEELNNDYDQDLVDIEDAVDYLNYNSYVVGQTEETVIYQVF